jgi:hypothetical protein
MTPIEVHQRLSTLVFVARQLAQDMASMPEAEDGKISKYATYLIGLAADARPRIGRCAVAGWGETQRLQVIGLAREAATEVPGAMATAVISKHATSSVSTVEVSVFINQRTFVAAFSCVAHPEGIQYAESDEAAKRSISQLVQGWVESLPPPKRKKFLGLF